MPVTMMAVRMTMTNSDGEVRDFSVESGGSVTIEAGDHAVLPEIVLSEATIGIVGDDDVIVSAGGQSVTLVGFYDCLDAEQDVALGFADSAHDGGIETLGALLAQMEAARDVAAATDNASAPDDDVLFFANGAIAGDGASPVDAPPDSVEVVFLDLDALSGGESGVDYGYLSAPVLALGDLIDMSHGTMEIEIGAGVARGAAPANDEFEGYFDAIEMADGQLYRSALSDEREPPPDSAAPDSMSQVWLYGSLSEPAHDGWVHFSHVDSAIGDLDSSVGGADTIWLV